MRLVLEIISGPLTGKRVIAEDHQTLRIGRTAKADFPTEDSFMSGEHFAVEGAGRSWFIRDLKSRNGTKLNGKVVSSSALEEGDIVHAGSTDFVVKFESEGSHAVEHQLLNTLPPAAPPKVLESKPIASVTSVPPKTPPPLPERIPSKPVKDEPSASTPPVKTPSRKASRSASQNERPTTTPRRRAKSGEVRPNPAAIATPGPVDSYEAATPEGRLLRLLQDQPEPLMGLVDATHDRKVLQLLKESVDEYQSLYQDDKSAAIAPYLVLLPPHSQLLKQMVRDGWGHGWGVYLTCGLPLAELRDYMRKVLMVRLPDGVELFSRFYDPRYFRVFLETCTVAEAEKFFGPVSSYLMEAEKPEILLQFTRTSRGIEKKGHLISTL